MTASDDSRDDSGSDTPEGATGSDVPRDAGDFDAAFRAIVENYGERPTLGEPAAETRPEPERPVVDPGLFDTSHLEAPQESTEEITGRIDREEHFVPPEPPPVPRGTPARRLAWLGLFAPPLLMLAAVVFGWSFADWASMLLVLGFVTGFVFLVATMPRDRGDDGDDGAVV